VGALEVIDLDFDVAGARFVETADQLDADRAAVLLEAELAQQLRAHEPEVAVDVPDRKPEQEPHRGRVDRTHHAPVDRVGAIALVALDPVDVRARVAREPHELGGVVLTVAVRVEDPVAGRGAQRGPQRAAVAPVAGVLDDPQARLQLRYLPQPAERVVAGAIIDDDDLAVCPELVEGPGRPLHQPADRLRVVVTEQARRDRLGAAQASAAQTRSTSSSVSSG
jgi:hypothetical protein